MIKKIKLRESALVEKVQDLRTMSQDEYDSMIDEVLDLLNDVTPVDYTHDLEARIQKIKADASDPKKTKELRDEDEEYVKQIKDERKALRAKEREKERYQKRINSNNQSRLKDDIFQTISDQIREYEQEEDTWQMPNRRYSDDPDMVVKGHRIEDVKRQDVPSIDVFLDYSGSWDESDLIRGRDVIADLIEFVDDGKLKLNLFYFTNNIATTPEGARAYGTGTGAWESIVNQIINSDTKNVMILTDSDMDWSASRLNKKVLVDGCVWYLWKQGVRAPELPKYVKGRLGTLEYNLV